MEATDRRQPRVPQTGQGAHKEEDQNLEKNYTDEGDENVMPIKPTAHRCFDLPKVGLSHTTPQNTRKSSYYKSMPSFQMYAALAEWTRSESNSSSKDDYLDKSNVTGHEESDALPNILVFHPRQTGPAHAGLR